MKVPALALCLAALVFSSAAFGRSDATTGDLRARLDEATRLLATAPAREVIDDYLVPVTRDAADAGDVPLRVDALTTLGGTYQRLGMTTLALDALTEALSLADGLGDPARRAAARDALGLAYRAQGRFEEAFEMLQAGLDDARQANRRDLEAAILNDTGLTWALSGQVGPAAVAFERAATMAGEAGLSDLQATACINGAHFSVDQGELDGVAEKLAECSAVVDRLDSPRRRAAQATAIGTVYAHGQRYHAAPAEWRLKAFEALDAGRQAALEAGDGRSESYALGYIGGLYEDERRHEEALAYSRRAAFLAQANDAPEALYLWQWQIARALRGLGDMDGAIVAYRQSIGTLNQIKGNLVAGSTDTFRERVGPVFFELADLLLERSATLEDPALVERNLLAVRETIEEVKVAEVQEYFRDACMVGAGSSEEVESVASDAAIVYPILFPDRTELLVSLPSGLKQYTSRVGLEELTQEVRDFRREIERFDGQEDYLNHGRRLYGWLLEPLVADLEAEGIHTIVMVPDGPLRTIPMSALYDGRQFMIERFAFATTPGLTLTSPQPLARTSVEMLASGLTESVQGFPALPSVATELESIGSRFPSKVYKDADFQVARVEDEIARGEYSIVHIATHGQFDSDHTRSFLLTYDDKLTMDDLQATIGARRYQEEPVELLVLSACQTAAGDDRAALGLAGVAIQAGARSAVATLWFISDESTAQMISEFYRLLEETSVSKAEALRVAQVQLLSDPRYRHPSYWAPFLLIGNWL